MASSNVLKEFLVKIAFRSDAQSYKNFQEQMVRVSKAGAEMASTFKKVLEASAATGAGVTAAATGMTAFVAKVSSNLESLYLASQRVGSSAKNLQTLQFAAEAIGVSAEQAQGAVEGLAAARRTNPGLNGILSGLGIDARQTDNVRVMVELLTKLRTMPSHQGAQVAGMFGIDERMLTQFRNNGPEFVRVLALREKLFKSTGANPDEIGRRSHAFMTDLRLMSAGFMDFAEILASRLLPVADKLVNWLEGGAEFLSKMDKATAGWSTRLIGLTGALLSLRGALMLLGHVPGLEFLGKIGRLGKAAQVGRVGLAAGESAAAGAVVEGGAAAGAAVAGEGAAVAGGSILGAVALPVVIIAAVGAALVWMMTHRDQVRKVVGHAWEGTKNTLKGVSQTIKTNPNEFFKGLSKTSIENMLHLPTGSVDTAVGKLRVAANAVGESLTNMTARFEGFRSKVYRDIAGNLTVGYGHLVRSGEDFSKGLDRNSALALLAKDMNSALASIHKLVKVNLTANQEKALSDFVFNVGGDKFSHSTMLRKLNARDFAGAADQFQYWNHALVNGHMTALQGLTDRRQAEAALFRAPDQAGRPVTINQKTDIHIDGAHHDVHSLAKAIDRHHRSANADLIRNMAGAIK